MPCNLFSAMSSGAVECFGEKQQRFLNGRCQLGEHENLAHARAADLAELRYFRMDGALIDGDLRRLKAARQLGYTELPVIVCHN